MEIKGENLRQFLNDRVTIHRKTVLYCDSRSLQHLQTKWPRPTYTTHRTVPRAHVVRCCCCCCCCWQCSKENFAIHKSDVDCCVASRVSVVMLRLRPLQPREFIQSVRSRSSLRLFLMHFCYCIWTAFAQHLDLVLIKYCNRQGYKYFPAACNLHESNYDESRARLSFLSLARAHFLVVISIHLFEFSYYDEYYMFVFVVLCLQIWIIWRRPTLWICSTLG